MVKECRGSNPDLLRVEAAEGTMPSRARLWIKAPAGSPWVPL